MTQTFKRQIRFAVTGAAGFIGARLAARWIKECGLNPEELLLVDDVASFDQRAAVLSQESLRFASKMNAETFLKEFEAGSFPNLSCLFHMGACSRTDEIRWAYLREINLNYTKKLWHQCSRQGIPFYYAGSAASYGAGDQGYSDNLDPAKLRPLNLYGQSKSLFDLWAQEQCALGQQPPQWAGFRFFNVYGPFEFHKGSQASVVMHGFLQLRSSGKIRLFKSARPEIKDGEQKRDFIYIDDVVDTLLEFQRRRPSNGIYNLGRGRAQSFLDLAQACAATLAIPLVVDWIETPAHLQEHYQYFTEADTKRLVAAEIPIEQFADLNEGAARYWEEWQHLERKGIKIQ